MNAIKDELRPSTSVLVLGFARIETLTYILEIALRQDVSRVVLVLDGPRNPEEAARQDKILGAVKVFLADPKFSVITMGNNVGIRNTLSYGLNEIFKHDSRVIVLEDDCIPTQGFFDFTLASLCRYAEFLDVGLVSGRQGLSRPIFGYFSYISRIPETWGWATWKDRRLQEAIGGKADSFVSGWSLLGHMLSQRVGFVPALFFRRGLRKSVASKHIWDYQLACYLQFKNLKTVRPSVNLVNNVGFDNSATHTKSGTHFERLGAWSEFRIDQSRNPKVPIFARLYMESLIRLDIYLRVAIGIRRALKSGK